MSIVLTRHAVAVDHRTLSRRARRAVCSHQRGVNRHTGEKAAALGEIVGVAEGKHKAYNLKGEYAGGGKWTDGSCRGTAATSAFMIAEVSNSPVTDANTGRGRSWRRTG